MSGAHISTVNQVSQIENTNILFVTLFLAVFFVTVVVLESSLLPRQVVGGLVLHSCPERDGSGWFFPRLIGGNDFLLDPAKVLIALNRGFLAKGFNFRPASIIPYVRDFLTIPPTDHPTNQPSQSPSSGLPSTVPTFCLLATDSILL